jgi:hypothetical protein
MSLTFLNQYFKLSAFFLRSALQQAVEDTMKRVVSLLILALLLFPAASVFSQNWSPGPPMAPMPQTGVPMPVMGQPGPPMPMPGMGQPGPPMPMPGLDSACMPMPICQPPMPCGMSNKRGSLGGMIGWQINNDMGNVKFSTKGAPVFYLTSEKLNLNNEGLWLGASGRAELSDCLSARLEYRHFFPSKKTVETLTPLQTQIAGNRTFNNCHLDWNVADVSAGYSVACGVSAIGGFRWDGFTLSLSHPPVIDDFSSSSDQGDFSINSFQPYGGAEFSWSGCDTGILIRAIGSPWVATTTKYGMTFGAGNLELPWIRDHILVNSKWSSFVEASLYVGKKLTCDITISGFGMVNTLWAHGEATFTATRDTPSLEIAAPFDMDLNRRSFIVGGNVAVAVQSPL